EAAHQRRNLGPERELAAGAGLHQPDALDADHLRGFSPLAPAHVHFGMVDAERLDLDDDMTGLGLRVWNLLVHEAVGPSDLSKRIARITVLQLIGTDSGCEEAADHRRDLRGMRFQREVTRVEEADDGTR